MATNNAINLSAQGVAYYDGAGTFSAPSISQYYTVVGAASNSLTAVAPGTSGFVLTSNGASANPSYQAVPTISFPAQYDTLASTGSALDGISPGTSGQVLTSNGASAYPTYQDVPVSYMPWTVVTGATQALAVNHGYISNAASGGVAYTLPASAAVGTVIEITGLTGGSGWSLAQNDPSQVIDFGAFQTTPGSGGSLASTGNTDSIRMVCAVADTEWVVLSSVGNITIV